MWVDGISKWKWSGSGLTLLASGNGRELNPKSKIASPLDKFPPKTSKEKKLAKVLTVSSSHLCFISFFIRFKVFTLLNLSKCVKTPITLGNPCNSRAISVVKLNNWIFKVGFCFFWIVFQNQRNSKIFQIKYKHLSKKQTKLAPQSTFFKDLSKGDWDASGTVPVAPSFQKS